MKEYTAIYSTQKLQGIKYSFRAESEVKAVEFADRNFSAFPFVAIIENDDSESATCGRLIFLNGIPIKG